MGPALQKMQDDDTANPGMLFVQLGEQPGPKPAGAANKSCADCHGAAAASMKGVAARYPAIPQGADRPVDLEGRINLCRTSQPAGRAVRAGKPRAAVARRLYHLSVAWPADRAAGRCTAGAVPRAGRRDLPAPPGPAQPLLRHLPRRQCRQEAGRRHHSGGASHRLSDLSPGMAIAGLVEAPAAQLPGRHSRRSLCLRRARIRGARDLSDGPRQGHAPRRSGRTALTEGKYSPAPAPGRWICCANGHIRVPVPLPLRSAGP